MALVFAVFILALVVVFLRTEGRASRIAQLRRIGARTTVIARVVLHKGSEAVDRIAADLAEEHRGPGGVNPLLSPADGPGTDPLEQSAESRPGSS